MYILFINSDVRRDIFFLLNLIIIVIKKINQPMWVGSKNLLNSTQPDPCTPLGQMQKLL